MFVCISLHRLFTVSRLSNMQSCMSTISRQFPGRRLCLTNRYSQLNCCINTAKTSYSRYQWLSFRTVLKSEEATWQKTTWQCGFHTTPQRNIHPLFWLVIRPLAKVASALTGRLMHVFLLWLLIIKNINRLIISL